MTDTPEAVRLADALEDIAATSSCMFEDEATEAAALLRRIPELEAGRDRWRDAERSLSESYVRIREAIGAMRPPSLETDALWSYVEQTARDLVAERDQLRAELEKVRVPEGWVLVPVEPTPEMVEAACQDGVSVEGRPVWKHSNAFQAKWKYQQMLTAAPTPPHADQKGQ